jgi:hypothetical protein
MNRQLTNITTNLAEVFNSENNVFINSSSRNVTMYPNANDFKLVLNQGFSHVQEVVMTHFIVDAGVIPAPYIYIIIEELQTALCYNTSNVTSNYNFVVPGGAASYVSQGLVNDKVVLPKQGSKNINTWTVRVVDNAGAPIVINNFMMKLYVRSYY